MLVNTEGSDGDSGFVRSALAYLMSLNAAGFVPISKENSKTLLCLNIFITRPTPRMSLWQFCQNFRNHDDKIIYFPESIYTKETRDSF